MEDVRAKDPLGYKDMLSYPPRGSKTENPFIVVIIGK